MKFTYIVVIALTFIIGCSSPVKNIEMAEVELAAGNHDGAIALYEEIKTRWPESREVWTVDDLVVAALLAKADAKFVAGSFEKAGTILYDMEQKFPESSEGIMEFDDGPSLLRAAIWAKCRATMEEGCLKRMIAAWEAESGEFQKEISKWTCNERENLPRWKECSYLPSVDDLDPKEAQGFLEGVEAACLDVAPLEKVCGEEHAGAIRDVVEGTALKQFRKAVGAKVSAWEASVAAELKGILREAEKLGKGCESANRRRQQIEDKWTYKVLMGSRSASIQFALEQKPYNQKISDSRERIDELEKSLWDKDWPKSAKTEAEAALEEAEDRCEW